LTIRILVKTFSKKISNIFCGQGENPHNTCISKGENKSKLQRWSGLKGVLKGERAFLIGNGPSLNKTPLHFLKNDYKLCFNRFYLMDERLPWKPNLYMCVDERVAEDTATEINHYINDADYAFFPDIHPSGLDFRKFIDNKQNIYWLSLEWGGFFTNLPKAGLGGTVANTGLQVLAYLGFSPIYLVGVDMDYKDHTTAVKHNKRDWTSVNDDDPNHFDPRYFGKGKKYHYPRLHENMLPSMKQAKEVTQKIGVEVYNAGIGGSLEVFPRVDFHELFNKYSVSEELSLLFGAREFDKDINDIYEAFPDAISINTAAEWNDSDKQIITDIETAQTLIPKVIFTHIPYGPIKNSYIFEKR